MIRNGVLARAFHGILRLSTIGAPQHLGRYVHPVARSRNSTIAQAGVTIHPPTTLPDTEPGSRVSQHGRGNDAKRDRQLSRRLRMELDYLQDEWKLGHAIRKKLENGQHDEALEMVRMASGNMDTVVSWNHLIDHEIGQHRVNRAVKLFNEMKKRAQMPNAQTFTIIFRGCAKAQNLKQGASEAIRIYHTMLSNKVLSPNIIHLNAVLEVCARAADLESMFSIASTAEWKTRSPNALTYTIMLNGIRAWLEAQQTADNREINRDRDHYESQLRKRLHQAKTLWEEVVERWRSGKLLIDENLVCSMGRLLLLGKRTENEQVFALLQQTMQIPRLDNPVSQLTSPGRPRGADEGGIVSVPGKGQPGGVSNPGIFAVPGTNTLSLILSALYRLRKTSLALKYYGLFVQKYNIQLDRDNWHALLKAFRRSHSSLKAADMLNLIPRELMTSRTFQLALSSCFGDTKNPSVMKNATKILAIMTDALDAPDPQSLRDYLSIAQAEYHHSRKQQAGATQDTNVAEPVSASAVVERLLSYVDHMWPAFQKSMLHLGREIDTATKSNWGQVYNYNREIVSVVRMMIGVYDRVVAEGFLEAEALRDLKEKRDGLNIYVTEFYQRREEFEPKLRRALATRGGEDSAAGV